VIVRKGAAEKISSALKLHCKETSTFQYISVDDDEDVGTAETLQLLKGKTEVCVFQKLPFREISITRI